MNLSYICYKYVDRNNHIRIISIDPDDNMFCFDATKNTIYNLGQMCSIIDVLNDVNFENDYLYVRRDVDFEKVLDDFKEEFDKDFLSIVKNRTRYILDMK